MKTLRTLLVIAIVTFGLVSTSFAQKSQDAANGVASGTIITPIAIVKQSDLKFGTIVSSASEQGTVVVPTSGAAAYTTVAAYNGTGVVAPSPAIFNVSGNASNTFSTVITDFPTEVKHSVTTTETMAVSAKTEVIPLSLDGNGAAVIKIGATLTVKAAQLAGTYTSAPFTVTVNYN